MTTPKYLTRNCYACDTPIMVDSYDVAVRNYCQTCAFAKLGAVRIPNSPNGGEHE